LIEAVGTLGAIINFWSWQAVLLFAVQIAMQLTRMHNQEKFLSKLFLIMPIMPLERVGLFRGFIRCRLDDQRESGRSPKRENACYRDSLPEWIGKAAFSKKQAFSVVQSVTSSSIRPVVVRMAL